MPPLNALWYFAVAARKKSFVAAAKELNVTPAAISHQIKTLEDYLGVQLFLRQSRKVQLTKEGQSALPLLNEGFAALAEAGDIMRQWGLDSRSVTVCCEPLFATKWLVPRLHRFYARCPDAEIRLQASLSSIDSKKTRSINPSTFQITGIDIAVRFGLGDYEGLEAEKLWETMLVPVCAPELLNSIQVGDPAALSGFPLLNDSISDRALERFGWREWFAAVGCPEGKVIREMRFGNTLLALEAASAGQGILLADPKALPSEVFSATLMVANPASMKCPYSYYIVCPTDHLRNPVTSLFRDWILEEAVDTSKQHIAGCKENVSSAAFD